MNEFKFQLTTFILVALLAFGGYWAFTTLDSGVTYTKDEVVPELDNSTVDTEPIVEENPTTVPETPVQEVTYTEEETQLLEELEELIDDDIYMKEGSYGTRVGTVQKFLNLYLEEQTSVDNDYGPTTVSRVEAFQSSEGLTADGQAGPNTYQQMIDLITSGQV